MAKILSQAETDALLKGAGIDKEYYNPVHRPEHYTKVPDVEAIDVCKHFDFCIGNAIKYLWRYDYKGKPIEDLRKAKWYIEYKIKMLEKAGVEDEVLDLPKPIVDAEDLSKHLQT